LGPKSSTANQSAITRLATAIFFSQRPGLRLTSHSYSPSVLDKVVRSSARQTSFDEAAEALADLAEVTISGRHVGRIAAELGQQFEAERDHQVEQFLAHQLKSEVETRPALAVVGVDRGQLQIRDEGDGPGAHNGSWREDKITVLATVAVATSELDREPDLPACFRDQNYVENLVCGIGGQSAISPSDPQLECPTVTLPMATDKEDSPRKPPELLVRTYVASTRSSDEFGPMVAAEAQRRNFNSAVHRVFLPRNCLER
jgi:hypothetical protein